MMHSVAVVNVAGTVSQNQYVAAAHVVSQMWILF